MNQDQLTALLEKFRTGTLNPEEKSMLAGILRNSDDRADLEAVIDKVIMEISKQAKDDDETRELIYQQIALAKEELNEPAIVMNIRPRIRLWQKIAIAASVIVVLAVGGYLLLNKNDDKPGIAEVSEEIDVKSPAINRAMIKLADGRVVYLDSAANGQLAVQDNVKLIKLANGKISYQSAVGSGQPTELIYNTLTNPRGSKVIDMALADGSHVWLNAGSSVTYPIAFTGNERKVSITGEAYFEVAHDKTKPFYVTKGNMQVQVLGTRFNVNAYDDEQEIKVTLLEGAVKVHKGDQIGLLKPGEQAQVAGDINVIKGVDLENVMAWKNGLFDCNGLDLATILRQAARWYDVEVVYQSKPTTEIYMGSIPRNVKLSELLKILQLSGVKFSIEGQKLIVM